MKNFFTIVSLFIATVAMAQTPQGFNYQAVIRNSTGAVVANQEVSLKFNIIQGQATNTATYIEQHTATTDDFGTVNLVVGQGISTSGTFQQINWALGNYFLGIEVNIGQGFVTMGTTQLLSVPYALYAATSGSTSANTILLSKLIYIGQTITADYLVPSYQEDYTASGYFVGLTANPTQQTAIYTSESPDEFKFQSDLFFEIDTELPAGTALYVRAWIRKVDGTYVYSQQRSVVTQ
ncbi:hypothetical protein ACX0HA_14680 [Flavobacterium hauense]